MGSTIGVIIFVIVIVYAIAMAIRTSIKRKELTAAGDIKTRQKNWIYQTTTFSTSTDSLDKIYQVMDIAKLRAAGIECGSVANGAVKFRLTTASTHLMDSRGTREVMWETNLITLPMNGQAHQYKFSFQNVHTVNGSPQGAVGMNMLLTQIEKAVLALDPQAQVQRTDGQYSTQTNTRRVIH